MVPWEKWLVKCTRVHWCTLDKSLFTRYQKPRPCLTGPPVYCSELLLVPPDLVVHLLLLLLLLKLLQLGQGSQAQLTQLSSVLLKYRPCYQLVTTLLLWSCYNFQVTLYNLEMTLLWPYYDRVMTLLWPCYNLVMTLLWPCDDFCMTLLWPSSDLLFIKGMLLLLQQSSDIRTGSWKIG